jgi:hypothetical protein
MMIQRQVAINAAGGELTLIRCSLGCTTKMKIVEDGSANGGVQQGLQYNLLRLPFPGENTAAETTIVVVDRSGYSRLYVVEPTQTLAFGNGEPILIEGYPGDHPPNTAPIGNGGSYPNPVCPGGPVTDGTPILQIISNTADATTINITEWAA